MHLMTTIILIVTQFSFFVVQAVTDCDQMFVHTDGGSNNGTFSSKNYGRGKYPPDLQCIYTFVAKQNHRVKIVFDQFELTGTATNCNADYIDIYSELVSPEVNLVQHPYSGRYCGTVSPRIRISYHNVLVIVFHSKTNSPGSTGFHGTYSFIASSQFIEGTPETPGLCGFNINSKGRKRGQIISPTYPGTYPKNLHCYYRFQGKKGERIKLLFRDFDLYFGGEHCPYDSMTIYDGKSNADPIIRKMCGLQQEVELYSETGYLYLEFNASKPSYAEHRGFLISYQFSNQFVDVAKLIGGQSGVSHIRGSECDLRVTSNRETTHVITSPNYPDLYPPNTTCIYLLDGLQGLQNLEKVMLKFHAFSIASQTEDPQTACPGSFVGLVENKEQQKMALKDPQHVTWDHEFCGQLISGKRASISNIESNGARLIVAFISDDVAPPPGNEYGFKATVSFETVYLDGQDWTAREESPNMYMCSATGQFFPDHLWSNGPRMVLKFQSADSRAQGFRASTTFKTDFGIPGEAVGPASNKCQFKFESFKSRTGSFNSPRYPSNYPTDTNCTYFLNGQLGEMVRLSFEQFHLNRGTSLADRCGDWLELYDVFPQDSAHPHGIEQLKARYCAGQFPGPMISAHGAHKMKVVFHSDSVDAGTGFKANYDFKPQPSQNVPSGDIVPFKLSSPDPCGGRLGKAPAGWFASPGYQTKYKENLICTWEITVRSGYRVLLLPTYMNVEGEMHGDHFSYNCQKAVIHIYTDLHKSFTHQFCGTSLALVKPVLSKNNILRISFLTAPIQVNGLKGFNFTWTEVIEAKETGCAQHSQFRCFRSKLCIDKSLQCNNDRNCDDNSDEAHCTLEEDSSGFRTIILAAAGGTLVFLVVTIIGCIIIRKRWAKTHKKHHRHHTPKSHRFREGPSYKTPQIKLIRDDEENV